MVHASHMQWLHIDLPYYVNNVIFNTYQPHQSMWCCGLASYWLNVLLATVWTLQQGSQRVMVHTRTDRSITEQVSHNNWDESIKFLKQSVLRIQAYCHQLKSSWHYSKDDTILMSKTALATIMRYKLRVIACRWYNMHSNQWYIYIVTVTESGHMRVKLFHPTSVSMRWPLTSA